MGTTTGLAQGPTQAQAHLEIATVSAYPRTAHGRLKTQIWHAIKMLALNEWKMGFHQGKSWPKSEAKKGGCHLQVRTSAVRLGNVLREDKKQPN